MFVDTDTDPAFEKEYLSTCEKLHLTGEVFSIQHAVLAVLTVYGFSMT
jgi:hypothetical protein